MILFPHSKQYDYVLTFIADFMYYPLLMTTKKVDFVPSTGPASLSHTSHKPHPKIETDQNY